MLVDSSYPQAKSHVALLAAAAVGPVGPAGPAAVVAARQMREHQNPAAAVEARPCWLLQCFIVIVVVYYAEQ